MHVDLGMCLHAFIHTCMYVHGDSCMSYIHTYLYIYTDICACLSTYIHTYLHANMHAYMHACLAAHIHTFICTYTYVNTCIHIHVCLCTYKHIYMHEAYISKVISILICFTGVICLPLIEESLIPVQGKVVNSWKLFQKSMKAMFTHNLDGLVSHNLDSLYLIIFG